MENKTLTGYPSIDKPWLKNFTENADKIVSENQNFTVYQYLYNQNKDYQNEYAIRYFGVRITYGELFDNIERFAKALVGYGIKDGDYVTLCLPNIPEAVFIFYALSTVEKIICDRLFLLVSL